MRWEIWNLDVFLFYGLYNSRKIQFKSGGGRYERI